VRYSEVSLNLSTASGRGSLFLLAVNSAELIASPNVVLEVVTLPQLQGQILGYKTVLYNL
jgi:hypothetical protein